jgi:hypothetical protein
MIYRPYPQLPLTDALQEFRAEFADIKSIADLVLLSPERRDRFKHQFSMLGTPCAAGNDGL